MRRIKLFRICTAILCGWLLVFFASCSTTREQRRVAKCERNFYRYGCDCPVMDTVTQTRYVLMQRDTTIFVTIQGEVTRDSIPVPSLITTPVNILRTRYAISSAWIAEGELHHELQQIESEIPKTIPNAISSATLNTLRIEKIPFRVEVPVKMPLSWLQKSLIYSGIIAWFLLLLILFLRFRKLFSRFKFL